MIYYVGPLWSMREPCSHSMSAHQIFRHNNRLLYACYPQELEKWGILKPGFTDFGKAIIDAKQQCYTEGVDELIGAGENDTPSVMLLPKVIDAGNFASPAHLVLFTHFCCWIFPEHGAERTHWMKFITVLNKDWL